LDKRSAAATAALQEWKPLLFVHRRALPGIRSPGDNRGMTTETTGPQPLQRTNIRLQELKSRKTRRAWTESGAACQLFARANPAQTCAHSLPLGLPTGQSIGKIPQNVSRLRQAQRAQARMLSQAREASSRVRNPRLSANGSPCPIPALGTNYVCIAESMWVILIREPLPRLAAPLCIGA